MLNQVGFDFENLFKYITEVIQHHEKLEHKGLPVYVSEGFIKILESYGCISYILHLDDCVSEEKVTFKTFREWEDMFDAGKEIEYYKNILKAMIKKGV